MLLHEVPGLRQHQRFGGSRGSARAAPASPAAPSTGSCAPTAIIVRPCHCVREEVARLARHGSAVRHRAASGTIARKRAQRGPVAAIRETARRTPRIPPAPGADCRARTGGRRRIRVLRAHLAPREEARAERRVAGGQRRVHHQQPAIALRRLPSAASVRAGRPSPAPPARCCAGPGARRIPAAPAGASRRRARASLLGLVALPKPTRSGATTRSPAARNTRDHLAIEIAPGRIAVQAQPGARARRAALRRGSACAARQRRAGPRRSAAAHG